MAASFVVYVDESGDEGFSFGRGSSDWFVLSAVICRRSYDVNLVKLLDQVRAQLGIEYRKPLHFRDLGAEARRVYLLAITQADLCAISVMIHKPSLREPETFRERYRLYFYAVRYLLERVSRYCADKRGKLNGEDGSTEIIFSDRSGMSYQEMRNYLIKLQSKNTSINWSVIVPENIISITHGKRAGLQLADAVASSFFNAARYCDIPNGDECANILKPIVYAKLGNYIGLGVKMWPKEVEDLTEYSWLLTEYK